MNFAIFQKRKIEQKICHSAHCAMASPDFLAFTNASKIKLTWDSKTRLIQKHMKMVSSFSLCASFSLMDRWPDVVRPLCQTAGAIYLHMSTHVILKAGMIFTHPSFKALLKMFDPCVHAFKRSLQLWLLQQCITKAVLTKISRIRESQNEVQNCLLQGKQLVSKND